MASGGARRPRPDPRPRGQVHVSGVRARLAPLSGPRRRGPERHRAALLAIRARTAGRALAGEDPSETRPRAAAELTPAARYAESNTGGPAHRIRRERSVTHESGCPKRTKRHPRTGATSPPA